ncbi:hypothetical protein [Sphingomonas sp. M1A8_2b]
MDITACEFSNAGVGLTTVIMHAARDVVGLPCALVVNANPDKIINTSRSDIFLSLPRICEDAIEDEPTEQMTNTLSVCLLAGISRETFGFCIGNDGKG